MKLSRRRQRRLRTTLEVMGSSRSDEWPTDPTFFAKLAREFGPFDLDPCATVESAKCLRYFTRAENGLDQEWRGRVFMNPPYGRTIGSWMRKAWEASQTTAELVVCLVPARTDTRWWHDWATRGEVRFLRGRLRFGNCRHPAPFPSAVVVFRNAALVTKPGTESPLEEAA
jgi:phage N-6-adenine-methyltransferase